MKRSQEDIGTTLDRLLARYGKPSAQRMKSAIDRTQERLRNVAQGEGEAQVPRVQSFRAVSWVMAAAVLALAIGVTAFLLSTGNAIDVHAVIESGTASLSRISGGKAESANPGEEIAGGEIFRANDATAAIKLADGSRLEFRPKTEFFLERANDGLRIHLIKGSLIVNAAKQDAGHLYVQTKDILVSVVGTVFLVNAEEEGSRVAVIEGEVRVQQGAETQNLLPGEQMSTNPKMDPLPVEKEVAWSPNAEVHVALLQQTTAPSPTRPAPPRLEFEVVSIRPPAPGGGSAGFACRGIDGIRRANVGEQGTLSFPAPQGRCMGYGVSLGRLIEFAYKMPHRMGPDTPDWSRPYGNVVGERPRSPVTYQVEAVAENPATVTLEQLRQMLRAMLDDRFKLESHVEMQEAPIYTMVIASGGIKFKETADKSGEEYVMPPDFSNIGATGGPILRGRSRMDKLAQFVTGFINPLGFLAGDLASHVEDRTGLPGIYEYELALPVPGGGARGADGGIVRPPTASAPDQPTRSFGWRAPAMSDELEHQLGLKLQLQKVRTEVLIVDKVERPSDN